MSAGPRVRVGALVVNNGRLLLVRHQKAGRTYWLLPGGGVEEGESLADALRRELLEECGIEPAEIRGPIALIETIPPDDELEGRHILHLIFDVEADQATADGLVSHDDAVVGHAFVDQSKLSDLDLRPPIHDYLRLYTPGDPFVALGRMWVR